MANAVSAIFVFTLTCLLAFSAALPPTLNQITSSQADPNIPRTLLGQAYRRCSKSKPCPPSCWIPSCTDRNNANTSVDRDWPGAHDGCSEMTALEEPHARHPRPLPLVLNAPPESEQSHLRVVKSKRPGRIGPCVDVTCIHVSDWARAGRTVEDEDVQRGRLDVASQGPIRRTTSGRVSGSVERSKRLYGRGEWKSRLLEEY